MSQDKEQEYTDLMKHLRGIRKIVINARYGGFGLSLEAIMLYLERSQMTYTLIAKPDRYSQERYGPDIYDITGNKWYDSFIARDDPILVSIVEELGDKVNAEHAKLKVVSIPANVEWTIEEYDGKEWVAEVHRTWS